MTDYMVVTCPHCGTKHNRHTHIAKKSDPPEEIHEGAITLCFSCGEFSVFDANHSLKKLTEKDAATVAADPIAMRIKEGWLAVMKMKRNG